MRGTWNIVTIFAAIPLVFDNLVSARVCVIGTEPDGEKVRFVLPPGDPCSCTDLELGGHNAYAPPRNDPPVYIDTLPMDAEGLRRNLGCARSLKGPPYAHHLDCQEVMDAGYTTSGVYNIIHKEESMEVYCDMETPDHGYMVFQRRINGSVVFDRTWSEYEAGFGDLRGEFWWGTKKLQSFTKSETEEWELVVDRETSDWNSSIRFAEFNITGPMYVIHIASSMDTHDNVFASNNMKEFSTKDRLDVKLSSECDEQNFQGGWWYGECPEYDCNLNGVYGTDAGMEGSAGLHCQREQITGSEMKMRRKSVKADSGDLVTQSDYDQDQNNSNDQGDNNDDQGDNNNDQGDNNNDQSDNSND